MSKINTRRSSKAQLMSIIMLVLFLLMVAELFSFTQLNVSSNQAVQSLTVSSASSNYGNLLKLSANNFAKESLSKAIQVLASYESTPSLRKGNFITNTSIYLSSLMINGVLPNDTSGYPQNAMGNLTLTSYNRSIANLLSFASQAITVNETKPVIFQTDSYSIKVSYTERILINASGNSYRYNIPVNVSISLNNTPDLFYAQRGSAKNILFASMNNITSVIGGAYATSGNTFSYAYGSIYNVPSSTSASATCPLPVPARLNFAPMNQSLIIATYNAIDLGSCIEKYAGLITYKSPSTLPVNVPYLTYASSTGILTTLLSGTRALLYGPGLDVLDIENMRSALMNNNFFASPFTPSYLDRASSSFNTQSPNGVFTFSNYDTQAASFTGSNYIAVNVPQASTAAGGYNTVSFWMYWKGNTNQMPIGFSTPYDLWLSAPTCFGFNTGSSDAYGINPSNLVNKWVFVTAMFYNGPYTGNAMIFINGEKQVLSQCAGSARSGMMSATAHISGWPGGAGYYFEGSLANFQVYNSLLSSQQVRQLYQQGISGVPLSANSLAVWYTLNGNSNDYSGNGNNGIPSAVPYTLLRNYTRDSIFVTPVPTQLSPLPGILSCSNIAQCTDNSLPHLFIGRNPLQMQNAFFQTANFNGANSYVKVLDTASLDLTSAFTLSAWINAVSTPNANNYVIGKHESGPNWYGYAFSLLSNARINVYTDIGGWKQGNVLSLNKWHNIVATSDNSILKIYVDGVLDVSVGSAGATAAATDLYFGRDIGGTQRFNGLISNVQIYTTPLSINKVQALYQAGIGSIPFSGNLVGWWPLNGNANDYSGNNFNGASSNVIYPYFSGAYSSPGLSAITISSNEWQAFGFN